ncbi:type I polyketide synthase [Streptomyces amritsarensis]|nr:type I polyketide synthase [Streptomyces amritsarensis]
MNEQALRAWLTAWLAAELDLAADTIDEDRPLADYGVGSRMLVQLSGALEDLLDRPLSPVVGYRAPTVASLVRHLTDAPAADAAPAADSAPDTATGAAGEPVAVIGIGCRFPGGGDTPAAFWRLLREGRDATGPVPPGRWAAAEAAGGEEVLARTPSRGGFLTEDPAAFDAEFFGISPREAAAVDPQQRLMLEVAWEALEHAGIPPRSLRGGAAGVFVGASASDYAMLQMNDIERVDAFSGTGSALSIIANRISYTLGLHGPSMVVDTACSSSLVAVHLAMQSLRSGECDLALAGGVNLLLSPAATVNFEDAGVMAADGRSKAFAAGADGYGRGEGCGLVVLKPLSRAQRDGDTVLAVLRAGAVNQDGASNGLMAPNPDAQHAVIRVALGAAGVTEPDGIDYVEAHGTGTELGDPLELEGIAAALAPPDRPRAQDLLIGSVKTNIGHLEAAAGIAGLIKVVLSLANGQLPPSLHFDRPNPHIPFDRLPVKVVTANTPWRHRPGRPRRAGVSGFGFGGTNAHLIVEEAPAPAAEPAPDGRRSTVPGRPMLFPVSAGSPAALRAQAGRLADWLTSHQEAAPGDILHTLATRRSHEPCRLTVVAADRAELARGLRAHAQAPDAPAAERKTDTPTPGGRGPVWVFSGQGSQWEDMGRRLLSEESSFARAVADIDPLVRAEAGFSVEQVLRSGRLPEGVDAVQPLLFTMQVALAAMWRAHGVRPAAVIGHSMGEVAAAVVAGALDLADGVQVICRRSALLTEVAGAGAMAVVGESEERMRGRLARTGLDRTLGIAVVPGPRAVVVSGDPDAVRRLVASCDEDEVDARTVRVDVASHSPQMDPLLAPLREALADLRPRTPEIPFFTTVGGRSGTEPLCDAAYWADNLRAPVRLAEAVRRAAEAGFTTYVEVSPHPVLTRDVAATLREAGAPAHVLPTLRRDTDPREAFLTSLGGLYRLGASLPWELWSRQGRLLDLPRLAWERRRHWTTARPPAGRGGGAAGSAPLPGEMTEAAALPGTFLWQARLRAGHHAPLDQHHVAGRALLPLSAYLRTALEAAGQAGLGPVTVRDLTVHGPLVLPSGAGVTVQTCLRAATAEGGPASLEFHGRAAGERSWTLYASARLHPDDADDADPFHTSGAAPQARDALAEPAGLQAVDPAAHRADLAAAGIEYGDGLWALHLLRRGDGLAAADLLPSEGDSGGTPRHEPGTALVDAGFQTLAACFPQASGQGGSAVVTGVDRFRFRFPAGGAADTAAGFRVTAATRDDGDGSVVADLDWYRDDVRIGRARGVRIRRTAAHAPVPAAWVHRVEWRPEPLPTATDAPDGRDGAVLVLTGRNGVGASLAAQIRASGMPCRTVDTAELTGLSAEAVLERLGDLADVRHIVHCAAPATAPGDGTDAAAAVRLAADTLHLLQAVGRRGGGARLWLVTSLAQAVGDHDTDPAQAQLWGMGRCFSLEHPESWGGLIDLDTSDGATCATAVRAELASGGSGVQCAYRDGVRLVPRLVRAVLPGPARPRPVDPDGAHLVVGATGRLGPLLLRRLVRLGARHLVVVGRRGVPDTVADAVRGEGAELTAVRADVADEDAMGTLFARFGGDLPALRGIYHMAFAEDVTPLAELDARRLADVLRPKVTGTAVLHRLSADLPVEEFLCYSSTTALLGSHSMAAYAAAGAFQDALLHLRRRTGREAHVVNWGTWATGLDGTPEAGLITATGMRLMAGERAVAALDHVIGARDTQWVVADADWPRMAAAYATRTPTPLLAHEAAPAHPAPVPALSSNPTDALSAALERAGRAERRALLRGQVREVVAAALDLPDAAALDPEHRFFDLGLDSLRTMTVIRRLKALVPGLRPTALRDNPTVNGFAETLLDLMDGGGDDTAR